MYETVIFDCFGVLTTDTWKEFLDSLPPSVDKAELRAVNQRLDAGWLSREEFLEQVHGISGSEPRMVETLLNNEVIKNEKLLNYIRELRQEGLHIGMLSNISTDWITSTFLTLDEQQLFDDMTFSYQVNMTKPNPEIFKLACSKLGSDPENSIFVDDVDSYCQAAKALGMAAIVYKDFDSFRAEIDQLVGSKK